MGLGLSLDQSGHVVMLVISAGAEQCDIFLIGNYIIKLVPSAHLMKQEKKEHSLSWDLYSSTCLAAFFSLFSSVILVSLSKAFKCLKRD